MRLFVPKEIHPGETRVALVPSTVERLVRMGLEVAVEPGLGLGAGHPDLDYAGAGARLAGDRTAELDEADAIMRVRKPSIEEIGRLKASCIHVSFLDPFRETALVDALAGQHVSAVSVDLIPQSVAAQGMDVATGQANLAGYVAVILAAERLNRIFPMLITSAGNIAPARVFVIGAGVAGLQAIATAKRLGARVDAYDTREVVAPQVQSLGARFIEIDMGETPPTDTYEKGISPEQLEKQRKALGNICAQSDVVIAAALVFGREAPRVITREIIAGMWPGSVIVDLAIESGGNVEAAELDKEVVVDGVRVIGRKFPHRRARCTAPTWPTSSTHSGTPGGRLSNWTSKTKSSRTVW
jgi:NAD(P) transhydrogenase subunit alpha